MARNEKKLILDSDYPMDKIVWSYEGQAVMSSEEPLINEGILHGLPFAPLIFGIYSTTADFTESYPVNAKVLEGLYIRANTNRFYVTNYDDVRYYYRLFAFAPSTATEATTTPTIDRASEFMLSTNYVYAKRLKAGRAGSSETVAHNLGYFPKAMVWAVSGSNTAWWQYNKQVINGVEQKVEMTSTTLSFSGNINWEYRLYR